MKKIAIIGASYLQKPLVLKAKQMGIETHCFAWEEGAVCKEFSDYFYPISILEKEKILEICQRVKINGIVTIASDLPSNTISYISEKMSLVGNSAETAFLTTNKFAMRNKLEGKKILIPNYWSGNDLSKIKNNLKYPLIVKPTDMSGSRGVAKVANYKELKLAFNNAKNISLEKRVIVEEFIDGKEISVEALSYNKTHKVLSLTDKKTTGGPFFVELEHHQPSCLNKKLQKEICKLTEKCLDIFNVSNGASHTEFKILKGRIYLIELGARMGGDFIGSHLVRLSSGLDYLKAVIEISIGTFNFNSLDFNLPQKYSGIYFLSKENKNIMKYFTKINTFDYIKKIQKNQLTEIKESNDRSGYLIYLSDKKVILK